MAYRFAAAVGFAGLVAALPAPAAPTVTVVTTTVVGAPSAPAAPAQTGQWQPQQKFEQPQGNVQPSPVVQSTPVVQQPTGSHTSSTSQPTGSSTPNTGSSAKYGGGLCVDGTIGDTQSAANKVAGSSGIKWWNNWGQTGSKLSNGAQFFPMLHEITDTWQTTPSGAIALAYNEPDVKNDKRGPVSPSGLCDQFKSNYLPAVKKANMQSTTPGVTSSDCKSNPSVGSCWIDTFLSTCTSDVDIVNGHFYLDAEPTGFASGGPDMQTFKDFIDALAKHGKPVLLSELGLNPHIGITWNAAQQATFMTAAVKYLETRPEVIGWAGYQVGQQPGNMNPLDSSSFTNVVSAITGGK